MYHAQEIFLLVFLLFETIRFSRLIWPRVSSLHSSVRPNSNREVLTYARGAHGFEFDNDTEDVTNIPINGAR